MGPHKRFFSKEDVIGYLELLWRSISEGVYKNIIKWSKCGTTFKIENTARFKKFQWSIEYFCYFLEACSFEVNRLTFEFYHKEFNKYDEQMLHNILPRQDIQTPAEFIVRTQTQKPAQIPLLNTSSIQSQASLKHPDSIFTQNPTELHIPESTTTKSQATLQSPGHCVTPIQCQEKIQRSESSSVHNSEKFPDQRVQKQLQKPAQIPHLNTLSIQSQASLKHPDSTLTQNTTELHVPDSTINKSQASLLGPGCNQSQDPAEFPGHYVSSIQSQTKVICSKSTSIYDFAKLPDQDISPIQSRAKLQRSNSTLVHDPAKYPGLDCSPNKSLLELHRSFATPKAKSLDSNSTTIQGQAFKVSNTPIFKLSPSGFSPIRDLNEFPGQKFNPSKSQPKLRRSNSANVHDRGKYPSLDCTPNKSLHKLQRSFSTPIAKGLDSNSTTIEVQEINVSNAPIFKSCSSGFTPIHDLKQFPGQELEPSKSRPKLQRSTFTPILDPSKFSGQAFTPSKSPAKLQCPALQLLNSTDPAKSPDSSTPRFVRQLMPKPPETPHSNPTPIQNLYQALAVYRLDSAISNREAELIHEVEILTQEQEILRRRVKDLTNYRKILEELKYQTVSKTSLSLNDEP